MTSRWTCRWTWISRAEGVVSWQGRWRQAKMSWRSDTVAWNDCFWSSLQICRLPLSPPLPSPTIPPTFHPTDHRRVITDTQPFLPSHKETPFVINIFAVIKSEGMKPTQTGQWLSHLSPQLLQVTAASLYPISSRNNDEVVISRRKKSFSLWMDFDQRVKQLWVSLGPIPTWLLVLSLISNRNILAWSLKKETSQLKWCFWASLSVATDGGAWFSVQILKLEAAAESFTRWHLSRNSWTSRWPADEWLLQVGWLAGSLLAARSNNQLSQFLKFTFFTC